MCRTSLFIPRFADVDIERLSTQKECQGSEGRVLLQANTTRYGEKARISSPTLTFHQSQAANSQLLEFALRINGRRRVIRKALQARLASQSLLSTFGALLRIPDVRIVVLRLTNERQRSVQGRRCCATQVGRSDYDRDRAQRHRKARMHMVQQGWAEMVCFPSQSSHSSQANAWPR